jgi:hypothetical protein
MKMKMKINYGVAVVVGIVLLIIFCVISVVSSIMSIDVLPENYIGAMLGSLIGAIITMVLLKGQTDIEEKKGKDIRILEKKIGVFQDFINTLWDVWKDQKIDMEEFRGLTASYYQNLMIYLKDEARLKEIGKALTAMGKKIGKVSYDDSRELRKNIVAIIDTLSADIGLGGKIDTDIMDEHDKIVFPVHFKQEILDKLNKALNDNAPIFNEGKYETIWEGAHNEHIIFELKNHPDVKLAIGIKTGFPYLIMCFMADQNIQQLNDERDPRYRGQYRNRLNKAETISDPTPDDADKEKVPKLDFSDEESMEFFRTKKHNFPDILAKRVLYHLEKWYGDGTGIEGIQEHFDKCLSEKE